MCYGKPYSDQELYRNEREHRHSDEPRTLDRALVTCEDCKAWLADPKETEKLWGWGNAPLRAKITAHGQLTEQASHALRLKCAHPSFVADVKVQRLTNVNGDMVVGFAADVWIACVVCGERFTGKGLPGGLFNSKPSVRADGVILIPLEPMSLWTPPTEYTYELNPQALAKLDS